MSRAGKPSRQTATIIIIIRLCTCNILCRLIYIALWLHIKNVLTDAECYNSC